MSGARLGPALVTTLALFSLGRVLAQSPTPSAAPPIVTSLTIFAGTPDGLWSTSDWGSTWRRAEARASGVGLLPLRGVRALLPVGPRVYAGGMGGVFVSDDFGLSWARFADDETVLALLPSRYPQSDPTLFVATAGGLFKTLDAGKTLVPTALAGTPVYRLEWPGPALVAACGNGVFVSYDAGASFRGPGEGLPPGPARALALSSFFQVDPVLFAGVGGAGVFRSSDAGKTWRPAGLVGREVHDLVWLGPLLYAATDDGVLRSEDLGGTWTPLNSGLAGRARRLLFPLAPDSGAVIFVGTDKGVSRSDDGGLNWRPSGMSGEDVLALATFPPPERTPGRRRR